MESRPRSRSRNQLLNALSDDAYGRLQPLLAPVELPLRKRLQSSNRPIEHVYFLESGIASAIAIGGGDRRQAEVGLIGREGIAPLPLVFGVTRSPCEVLMQVPGEGYRVSTADFLPLAEEFRDVRQPCLWFAHSFYLQAAYTALANARGKLDERLARWLLMCQDRIGGDVLNTTHEFLAFMLGVRRAGVTIALQNLEAQDLLATARGEITIRDRAALEEGRRPLRSARIRVRKAAICKAGRDGERRRVKASP